MLSGSGVWLLSATESCSCLTRASSPACALMRASEPRPLVALRRVCGAGPRLSEMLGALGAGRRGAVRGNRLLVTPAYDYPDNSSNTPVDPNYLILLFILSRQRDEHSHFAELKLEKIIYIACSSPGLVQRSRSSLRRRAISSAPCLSPTQWPSRSKPSPPPGTSPGGCGQRPPGMAARAAKVWLP